MLGVLQGVVSGAKALLANAPGHLPAMPQQPQELHMPPI